MGKYKCIDQLLLKEEAQVNNKLENFKESITANIFQEVAFLRIKSKLYFTMLEQFNVISLLKYFGIVFVLVFVSTYHFSPTNVYIDTVKQIKSIYCKSSTHAHEDFLELDIIKDSVKFKKFLEEILENKNGALLNVNGYYHPIGFIKIVLYKGEKGEQLRLHFWGRDGNKIIKQNFSDGWEPIHNHRWNFSSKVIQGGLIMKEYVDFNNGVRLNNVSEARQKLATLNKTFKIYNVSLVPTNNKNYKVIETGKFALIGNCMDKYVLRNKSYWLGTTTPHQVKSEKNTSTILLMDPPTRPSSSEIFPDKQETFVDTMNLEILTHKEIQTYLKEFLKNLDEETL